MGPTVTNFPPPITESVTRHRGAVRDENGELVASSSTALTALAVAPGGGSDRTDRGRTGKDVACTVYFLLGTDIVNSDELTVRGERFRIIVNEWRSPWTGRGGLEVLCTRGQG